MKNFNKWMLAFLVSFASLLAVGCGSTANTDEYIEDNQGTGQTQVGDGTGIDDGSTGIEDGSTGYLGPDFSIERVIYFDFDSYTVKAEARPILTGNAQYLRENPRAKVILQGHTDARGTSEYNLALGQKRAEAVRQAMLLMGVADTQVEAVSLGKEFPATEGAGESAWAQNRRVEFIYK